MKMYKKAAMVLLVGLFVSCSNTGNSGTADAGSTGGEKVTLTTGTEGVPIQLTKAEFLTKVFDFEKQQQWNFQGDMPAIIDFYADWCKPCKIIAPIMEDLAREYKGKIRVYKVNTDHEKALAGAFQIQSIPAVLFIPKTGQPQMSVGALSREEYVKMVETVLLPSMK